MIRKHVERHHENFTLARNQIDSILALQARCLLMDGMYTSLDRFADSEIQKARSRCDKLAVPSVKQAIMRGLRGCCPSCARGRLFRAFLKPYDACPACGQDWTHQRADDFPAYLVILLIGHLLVPIVIAVELTFDLPTGIQMVLWPSLVLVLILLLIGPAKGAVIALQWRLGMHGFTRPDAPKKEDVPAQQDALP